MSSPQPESIGESLRLILGADLDPLARMPMMRTAFEQVAQTCAARHSQMADSRLQMKLDAIDSGASGELLGTAPDAGIAAKLHCESWDCAIFASVDRALVFALVERLLGAEASEHAFEKDRAISKIETNLVRLFLAQLAAALGDAFTPDDDGGFVLADLPGGIGIDEAGGKSAFIALARFNVEALGQGGQLRLIVPRAALDAMRQALSEAPASAIPAPDPGWRRHIESEFGRSSVKLVAVLEERVSTLKEISKLKVGQIMQLAATPKSLVRVECNGEPMFLCRLGQSNGAYTLQVADHVDASQEFINDLLSA